MTVARKYKNLPVGELGIIGMPGCEELTKKIDRYLIAWRDEHLASGILKDNDPNADEDSFIIDIKCPRFGSGEGKGVILQTIKGHDLYIVCDCFNYGVTYKMFGSTVPMSPDDHFQDLKRIIGAAAGQARRINVIMPMLYEGRQHRRSTRESLDCAIALEELTNLGVANLITFDAHDPRVHNAIPLHGFESFKTTYQMLKKILRDFPEEKLDRKNLMIISPDEGGMERCIYYSSVLSVELGMFYKRRDYSIIVNGRNPIVAHEFLGDSVEGKDVIIVDDMISSGDSMLDIVKQLRDLHANRIFIVVSFGLFCEGLEIFDEAYKQGLFTKIYSTNCIYRTPELLSREWFSEVDMSKFMSYIIETMNYDSSMSELLDPVGRINKLLSRSKLGEQ